MMPQVPNTQATMKIHRKRRSSTMATYRQSSSICPHQQRGLFRRVAEQMTSKVAIPGVKSSVTMTKMQTTKVERMKVARMTGTMTKDAHGKNGLVKYFGLTIYHVYHLVAHCLINLQVLIYCIIISYSCKHTF